MPLRLNVSVAFRIIARIDEAFNRTRGVAGALETQSYLRGGTRRLMINASAQRKSPSGINKGAIVETASSA